jgi:hypothetical protein
MGWSAGGANQDTDHVGGRYRLVERLGTGGMAVVWRGYDEILGRQVAVKVLTAQLAGDDAFRDRLRQEALAAARLCHPHITGIFDFGETHPDEDLTVPYVVMELNDGESLSARLARIGALSWRDAVVVAAEVASALATAHARGIVHRDITPANVMLTSAGAKVVDFGISALIGQRDAAPDGSLLGTPAYLAPERLTGGQVLPATDVYALGLLLYRALTARLPWPAGSTTEALRAHLYLDPDPVPPIAGMPVEVADLTMRCLAKQPTDRPGAADIAHALAALAGVQAVIAPLDSSFVRPPRAAGNSATETIPFGPPSPRPPRRLAAAVGARLGLPALAGDVAAVRLRAGLRIGAALHLGTVRPLGGGLFAGSPAAMSRRRGISWRHRMQAAAATVTLLVAVGASWLTVREPAEAGPAQASAADTVPAVPVLPASGCKVRYQVRQDDGKGFEAVLSVRNTGGRTLTRWRLDFSYPGTQRLVDLPIAVAQTGRQVRLRGAGDRRLKPGKAVAVTLRGAYRGANPLPLAFDLNGHACAAEVFGSVTANPAQVSSDSATATGPARRKSSGSGVSRAG